MNLAAVIVETRYDNLIKAFNSHLEYFPDNTKLYVFGGEESRSVLRWYKLSCACSFFEIPHVDANEYNRMLTSKSFWEAIGEENILIFQHDSELLRFGIEEFYEYDFIGAPLYHIHFPAMNGGFSLRRKSAMLGVVRQFITYSPFRDGNEDIFFCNKLKQIGGKLPTKETAMKFSTETIFSLGSLGCHAIDQWFTPEQCEAIRWQYHH